MLFNSISFLFLFLPAAIAGFFLLRRGQAAFLCAASIVFYACWHAPDLLLLLPSIAVNYMIGTRLQRQPGKPLLTLGVTANIIVIGWFKYAGFLAASVNALAGSLIPVPALVLPLGVSFFTLHEVTWLVDSYKGKIRKAPFIHYALYILFFPQLIAGPIVRYTEVMDQYAKPGFGRFNADMFARGAALFCIGLCKKVLLADVFASAATPVFDAAQAGTALSTLGAWTAAVLYAFQIYFDFSGYSDMAVGLGLIFGITLPLNFDSPYKAASIIDFWHRWHMTLSRFLRDYLYIPLGGNRLGAMRRYVNLMLVMLIGGLWHGAAWTFVIWGALHGTYLLINHAWRTTGARCPALLSGILTFLAVTVAWVFFRAASLDAALAMLRAMAGGTVGTVDAVTWLMIIGGGAIVWLMPNSMQLTERLSTRSASLAIGAVAALAVFLTFTGMKSEFIYFQF